MKAKNIYSVELIPGRNDINILKKFVKIFHKDDFVITFGTEHNTPELIPLKVDTRGHIDLDDELKEISYQGACVIAAHQYLRAKGEEGFIDSNGNVKKKSNRRIQKFGSGRVQLLFQTVNS